MRVNGHHVSRFWLALLAVLLCLGAWFVWTLLTDSALERVEQLEEGQLAPDEFVLLNVYEHEAEWSLFGTDSTRYSRGYGSDLDPRSVSRYFEESVDLTNWSDTLGCFRTTGRTRDLVFTAARARTPGGRAADVLESSMRRDVFNLCVWELLTDQTSIDEAGTYDHHYLVEVWDRDSEPGPPLTLFAILLAAVAIPFVLLFGAIALLTMLIERLAPIAHRALRRRD